MRHLKLYAGVFVVLCACSIAWSNASPAKAAVVVTGTLWTGTSTCPNGLASCTGATGYLLSPSIAIPSNSTPFYIKCSSGTGLSSSSVKLYLATAPVTNAPLSGFTSLGSSVYSVLGGGLWYNNILAIYNTSGVSTSTLTAQCGGTIQVSDNVAFYNAPVVIMMYPTNGTTTPANFPYWDVEVQNYPSTTATLAVNYGRSASALIYNDTTLAYTPAAPATDYTWLRSESLWNPPMAIPSTWYAQAVLNWNGVITTSSVISFSVNPNLLNSTTSPYYSPYALLPTGAETSSTLASSTGNCTFNTTTTSALASFLDPLDLIGVIEQGACNALAFSFIPNSAEQYNLGVSFNAAIPKKKPPFGYFVSIMSDMQSFNVATSTTSTPLLNATSSRAIYAVYLPLDNGVATIVAFMLMLWFFNRGRHIEL